MDNCDVYNREVKNIHVCWNAL